MAVGATGHDIRRLVLAEGARLSFIGIGMGGISAVLLSRALTRFVFQISTLDLITFTVAPILLASATLLAALLPAQRATRVDPMNVLRAE